jgi:hypothetical protein
VIFRRGRSDMAHFVRVICASRVIWRAVRA